MMFTSLILLSGDDHGYFLVSTCVSQVYLWIYKQTLLIKWQSKISVQNPRHGQAHFFYHVQKYWKHIMLFFKEKDWNFVSWMLYREITMFCNISLMHLYAIVDFWREKIRVVPPKMNFRWVKGMKGMKGQTLFQQDVGVTCLLEHDLFFNYAFLHFSLQSCLCSLHIPTIQCPNSQCNEQANAGIKRIKDQHSYHRCKPQPNIQSSSSFDCGWVRRVFLVFHFSYWPMRVKRGQKMTFVSPQDTQSQTSLLYMFMMQ